MNVVKHARAHKLTVSLWRDGDHLQLRVGDDGVGCDISEIASPWRKHCGFGLFSIRERLNPFGGLMEVKSEPGAGTEVTLSVPLKDALLPV
jgi:signal transduction histidine kinase